MALILGIVFDFMWWIIGIGVVICMCVVLFGIIKYATAQGDPSRAANGRNTMAGGAFGVVALPLSIIALKIFFGDIVAPNVGIDASFLDQNCDAFLRDQLRVRTEVVTQDAAWLLIQAIQTQKGECASGNWMGTAGPFKDIGTARCGYSAASGSVRRAVDAAGGAASNKKGFARIGGAIVIVFDNVTTKAAHLGASEQCWVFDPGGGGWKFAQNS